MDDRALPGHRARHHGGGRRAPLRLPGKGPGGRAPDLPGRALPRGARPDRARPQGHPAHPHLAGALALLPLQRLEHRRRGAVPDRGNHRRLAGAGRHRRPPGHPPVGLLRARHPGRRGRRRGLGLHRRLPEGPLPRQRDPREPHAGLHREPPAQLPRVRAVEEPGRLQLPADGQLLGGHRGAAAPPGDAAQRRLRTGAPRRGGDVALHVPDSGRLQAPGRRAGPCGVALRGLLGALGAVVDAAPLRRAGRHRRRPGGDGADGAAHAPRGVGLRLHRHHRGLRGQAAPPRLRARELRPLQLPHRGRAGPVPRRAPLRALGRVPGRAPLLAACLRHAHPVPAALEEVRVNEVALLIAATLNSGTPLAIAGLGLLINERVGILNLGSEGMMLVGALAGYAVTFQTGNDWIGFAAGAAAGAVVAACFGWLVIWLNTNQYATGLAVSLFGGGLSAYLGADYVGRKLGEHPDLSIPGLRDVPFLGPALFDHHPLVYLTIVGTIALAWMLQRTRAGLVLRAVGENPESAHALGYPVRRIRLLAVVVGGALCGLAGAYISVVYAPLWAEGMVAGRGWIALALTVFATWRPARLLLGAYLFGGVTMLQLHLQGMGVDVAAQLMSMLPYLATILVLVLISRNPAWIRLNMPASLGKPFYPST